MHPTAFPSNTHDDDKGNDDDDNDDDGAAFTNGRCPFLTSNSRKAHNGSDTVRFAVPSA